MPTCPACPILRGILLASLFLLPSPLRAQLTTGTLNGILQAADGQRLVDESILVAGGAGFHAAVRTNSRGEFSITLPYGRYRLAGTVGVFVAPLQTTNVELARDASGAVSLARLATAKTPGTWSDDTSGRQYPEGSSLAALLLSREPASITEPLDFTGQSGNRLPIESQRGFSWTGTQFKLQGMDATDSYQPGLPAIVPDVQSLDEVVVRSDGTEIGSFLAEPGTSWHGALSTADTGTPLSSTNLPSPANRGLVQQASEFR
jgi:hypothetical protein